jgi:hypothetical protein
MITIGHDSNSTESTFDNRIFQGVSPTCAIRSQQIILRDYGIQIPQDDLAQYSLEQGWLDENGTKQSAVGNLLSMCGIGVHVSDGNSIFDLVNELQAGHRVIVGVDSRELWAEPGSEEWEFFHNIDNPDHALIVAGIKIDGDNPENCSVILTDPGKGDAYIEYPMVHFVEAWKDADCYMMATDMPAPYQYNEETGLMEMSNFATEYTIAEFPFHNQFSDIYEMGELYEYEPFYAEGHLDYIIEDVAYDDFISHWKAHDYDSLSEIFGINEEVFSDEDYLFDSLEDSICDLAHI